jgi:hypothetical protein
MVVRVIVACEFSGVIRDAFLARGHDAWSCDLLPTERPGPHIQGNVLEVLDQGWDLMIAHPPCTYLSFAAAIPWNVEPRASLARAAMAFVERLWNANIPQIAIENPPGRLNSQWRPASQRIHPCHFGEPWTKPTCLWLRNLPPLLSTGVVIGPRSWHRYHLFATHNRKQRAQLVARTFPGIAAAMAEQWGDCHSERAA